MHGYINECKRRGRRSEGIGFKGNQGGGRGKGELKREKTCSQPPLRIWSYSSLYFISLYLILIIRTYQIKMEPCIVEENLSRKLWCNNKKLFLSLLFILLFFLLNTFILPIPLNPFHFSRTLPLILLFCNVTCCTVSSGTIHFVNQTLEIFHS